MELSNLDPPAVDLATTIKELSTSADLPHVGFYGAKTNWSELHPIIADLIQAFIDDPQALTQEQQQLLFYGVMLMGDCRIDDNRYLPLILQMFSVEDSWDSDLEVVFGDALTELSGTLLYALAKDDAQILHKFILADSESMYVRCGAIEAVFAMFEAQSLPRVHFIAMMEQWIHHFVQGTSEIAEMCLGTICILCIDYRLNDYKDVFIDFYKAGKIDSELLQLEDIQSWGEDFPPVGQLESGKIRTPFDPLAELMTWHDFEDEEAFQEEELRSDEELMRDFPSEGFIDSLGTKLHAGTPYVAPPKVGRNDPCPCGSGKKHKKCCLK